MKQQDPRLSRGDEAVAIPGPVGALEAVVTRSNTSAVPQWLTVIGHPHPQMGGTLHNKVVHTVARAARDLGGLAVRFNYRGVEGSEGSYDEGVGEVADFLAVYRWALQVYDPQKTFFAGFSFGSCMAATALSQLGVAELCPRGLLMIAPPVARMPFDVLPSFPVPSYVLQGEADDVVEPQDVYDWCQLREEISEERLLRVPKADHFFHGCLSAVKSSAAQVMSACLALEEGA